MSDIKLPDCWCVLVVSTCGRGQWWGRLNYESRNELEDDFMPQSINATHHVHRMIPAEAVHYAVRAAVVRISQESDELGTVSASEAERIIWEEIDKRLEAKP